MNPNVDFTQTTSCLEWCAGYGGISLGLKRAIPSLRTIAFGEIEAFACANLVAKMEAGLLDPAPIWTDLKTFPCEQFRDRVDILVAGYPCQPFSAAGKRLGTEDPRHLWPFIQRSISIIRPRLCFFENVEGHITLGLSTVISDLEELGYKVSWGIFSASEVGAPHQRKRVFILAYRHGERGQLSDWWRLTAEQVPVSNGEARRDAWPSRPGEPQHGWEPPRVVANRNSRRQRECCKQDSIENSLNQQTPQRNNSGGCNEAMADAGGMHWQRRQSWLGRRIGSAVNVAGGHEEEQRQVEPPLGRDADGPADRLDDAELYTTCDNRTDELRLLGNGVVPATAERAFRVLRAELLTADTQ